VGTIVLDIDSEGGSVEGTPELWTAIYDARQRKSVVAVANSMMASAAYWLGSAATEIVSTPSGSVGSIGVLHVHAEESKALEDAGIKLTVTKAGKYKGEGSPFEPLTDEAKDFIQSRVDEAYSMFVKDVAKGRGVPVNEVRKAYGQGRLLGAKEAKELGMIDRIATLDETIERYAGKTGEAALMKAQTALAQADDALERSAVALEEADKILAESPESRIDEPLPEPPPPPPPPEPEEEEKSEEITVSIDVPEEEPEAVADEGAKSDLDWRRRRARALALKRPPA
jgi:signal peptide peptidase SppA